LKDRRKPVCFHERKRKADELPPFPHRKCCRTVLAGKGPLRRAKPARPCPLRAVLRRRFHYEGKGAERKAYGWGFFNRRSGEISTGLDRARLLRFASDPLHRGRTQRAAPELCARRWQMSQRPYDFEAWNVIYCSSIDCRGGDGKWTTSLEFAK
jgi:hypothetical protein